MNHFDCSKTGFLFAIALRPIYHEDVPVAARGSLRSCRAEKCTSAELPDATKQRITPGHYWHVLSVDWPLHHYLRLYVYTTGSRLTLWKTEAVNFEL